MSDERKQLGKQGEDLVAKYLEKNGYQILDANYSQKFGEIDLIAQKDDVLAFVEVKLRRNPKFYISELISIPKQRKIIKTALHYISKNQSTDMVYRFDVALLEKVDNSEEYAISYIKNAFTANNNY